MRLRTAFITICMLVISVSLAAVGFLVLGLAGLEAVATATTLLALLAAYHLFTDRSRNESHVSKQIADLSEGTTHLAHQVKELSRRLLIVEGTMARRPEQPVAAVEPIAEQIEELGALVNDLAGSVAAHEIAIVGAIKAANAAPQIQVAPPPAVSPRIAPTPVAESFFDEPALRQHGTTSVPAAVAIATAVPWTGGSAGGSAAESAGETTGEWLAGEAAAAAPMTAPPVVSPAAGHAVAPLATPFVPDPEIIQIVRDAVQQNRTELHLQPIVTLPQRKVRYYEGLMRIRSEDGRMLGSGDFGPHAESTGLMPNLDSIMLLRCAQVVRRLTAKNRELGLFCSVSGATLSGRDAFAQFVDFLTANRALSSSLIFAVPQRAVRAFATSQHEGLAQLAALGFRFAMDQVTDLQLEPRLLADQGFRFVKTPAHLVLRHDAAATASDIHIADLASLMSRHGIDLIGSEIDADTTVADILDYDIRFGQGALFGAPRPVRPDVFQPARAAPPASRDLPGLTEADFIRTAASAAPRRGAAEPPAASPRTPTALAQLAREMVRRA